MLSTPVAGSELRSRPAQKADCDVLLEGCAVEMRSAAILTFSSPTRSYQSELST